MTNSCAQKNGACQPAGPGLNRAGLPWLGYGLGLRTSHLDYILTHGASVDWFEIISENFLGVGGYTRYALDKILETTPVVLHGVSLSIGSTDPLDFNYLSRLKKLAAETEAVWVSDHLCWSSVGGHHTHDLLPIPFNEETLAHIIPRIRIVQEFLERPLILENPSSYISFRNSTMTEWIFLEEMCKETGCGLLLDLTNVHTSASNHGFSAHDYIDGINPAHVVQIHLAGPTDTGEIIIDTHDQPPPRAVWELYDYARRRGFVASVMIEWDAHIPPFPKLLSHLSRARQFHAGPAASPVDRMAGTLEAVSAPVSHLTGHHFDV